MVETQLANTPQLFLFKLPDSMDPNLRQPPLQETLHRKKMTKQKIVNLTPSTETCNKSPVKQNIYYLQYIPYDRMTPSETKKYLGSISASTGPKSKKSTELIRSKTQDIHWSSASPEKSLRVYEYHLAELSLNYRSSPSLRSHRQRVMSTSDKSSLDSNGNTNAGRNTPLFQKHHTCIHHTTDRNNVDQQLSDSYPKANGTQTNSIDLNSRSNRENTKYSEPLDIINRSQSNRLLNFVSVDECHVTHRQRKNRMRSAKHIHSDAEIEQLYLEEDKPEETELANQNKTEVEDTPVQDETDEIIEENTQSNVFKEQKANDSDESKSAISKKLSKIKMDKKQTEKDLQALASARASKRSLLLREKMVIYLDWKLHQEKSWRESLIAGNSKSTTTLRQQSAQDRVDRFSADLAIQEERFALEEQRNAESFFDDDARSDCSFPSSYHSKKLNNLTEMYKALSVDG